MRYNLIGVAAAMAFAGAATLAIAQQTPGERDRDRDKGPAAQDQGPDGKGQREPGKAQQRKGSEQPRATEQPRKDQPRATERPDKDRPKATERPDRDRPKATERPDKDRPKATERPDKDRPKATERPDKDRPKATERPDKDRPKATERPDKDRPKATERPDKDRPKATERPDKDRPKATERPDKDRPKATEGPDKDRPKAAEKKGDRVQVSEQQRSRVSDRIRQTRVEKTKIDVNVNIGARIPRSVRLHTLPAAIIEIAPAYRGYHYVVLENETIIIVNPQTYVVVDVISSGSRRADRPGRAQLTLSADERRFIFRTVPKDRKADVRVRLALGAEVPRSVSLQTFPGEVAARVPEVRAYRYIVADDDVVIVDPTDHAVILVISD